MEKVVIGGNTSPCPSFSASPVGGNGRTPKIMKGYAVEVTSKFISSKKNKYGYNKKKVVCGILEIYSNLQKNHKKTLLKTKTIKIRRVSDKNFLTHLYSFFLKQCGPKLLKAFSFLRRKGF